MKAIKPQNGAMRTIHISCDQVRF